MVANKFDSMALTANYRFSNNDIIKKPTPLRPTLIKGNQVIPECEKVAENSMQVPLMPSHTIEHKVPRSIDIIKSNLKFENHRIVVYNVDQNIERKKFDYEK